MSDDESSQQPGQQKKPHGCLVLIGIALAVGAFFGVASALGGDDSGSDSEQGGDPSQDSDATAESACRHFRNVAGEAGAGLLTDAELRTKLKEVHETARYADSAEIRQQSEAMLAAATRRDASALADAVERFGAACADIGQ